MLGFPEKSVRKRSEKSITILSGIADKHATEFTYNALSAGT
ncbi:hypothetical protein CH55_2476 [Yersinia pestis]|nr:hypothetical protein CH63_2352 [Yersinia pestis]AJK06268.1 hypothetical protein CH55_2476 [Yersinia pestis]